MIRHFKQFLFSLLVIGLALQSVGADNSTIKQGSVIIASLSVSDKDTGQSYGSFDKLVLQIDKDNKSPLRAVHKALLGKKVGDTIDITASPKEHVGNPDPELKGWMPIDEMPKDMKLQKGSVYRLAAKEGQDATQNIGANGPTNLDGSYLKILKVDKKANKVYLDLNHLWAGKSLVFKSQVYKIKNP